jgi:hypothetical protein
MLEVEVEDLQDGRETGTLVDRAKRVLMGAGGGVRA